MFNHIQYLDAFLSDYKMGRFSNNSVAQVGRTPVIPCFRIIGIHKLTPAENDGRHNLFVDVINLSGNRLNVQMDWGWEGRKDSEKITPLNLDKPPGEPAGNFVIWGNQKIWAGVLGKHSDKVLNVHTGLPDEGPGSTWGHHSYYCVWLWVESGIVPPPPIDETPKEGEYERGYEAGAEGVKDRVQEVLDKL